MAAPHSPSTVEDSVLAAVLDDANHFVRRLRLPTEQQHRIDNIVQDTMIIANTRPDTLVEYSTRERMLRHPRLGRGCLLDQGIVWVQGSWTSPFVDRTSPGNRFSSALRASCGASQMSSTTPVRSLT